jgi:hypothetical protein
LENLGIKKKTQAKKQKVSDESETTG